MAETKKDALVAFDAFVEIWASNTTRRSSACARIGAISSGFVSAFEALNLFANSTAFWKSLVRLSAFVIRRLSAADQ
jgi:hypothetical protein